MKTPLKKRDRKEELNAWWTSETLRLLAQCEEQAPPPANGFGAHRPTFQNVTYASDSRQREVR